MAVERPGFNLMTLSNNGWPGEDPDPKKTGLRNTIVHSVLAGIGDRHAKKKRQVGKDCFHVSSHGPDPRVKPESWKLQVACMWVVQQEGFALAFLIC
jgi:hypothetical protein